MKFPLTRNQVVHFVAGCNYEPFVLPIIEVDVHTVAIFHERGGPVWLDCYATMLEVM